MKKVRVVQVFIILVMIITECHIYNTGVEKIPIHWNIKGEPDRYASRENGSFILPIISIIIYVTMLLIPKIDPLSDNIKKFERDYEVFVAIILLLLVSLQLHILLWVNGIKIQPNKLIGAWLFVFFLYVSTFMKKTKRNWFIGIRTPWTISSERVWNKTHTIGSKMFMVLSLISLGMLVNTIFIYLLIASLLIVSIFLFVYSFLEFRKMKNRK